jgi:phosphoribosylglycinamide formyltransferase-1
MRVGVLVSGRGSNLGALIADAAQPGAPYRLSVVISNRGGAPALDRARAAGIPAVAIERKGFGSRPAQQREMVRVLREHGVDLVVMAGFDQILDRGVIAAFPGRILNVHPSLLPAFGGTLHAQRAALEYGVKVTGCTVHLVTDEVDGGPIVLQAAVPVHDGDTEASLSARILIQEHRLLPQAVRLMASGRVEVAGRRVAVRA